MRRKLPFLSTCGNPTKTLSFRAATAINGEFDDVFATKDMVSSVESVIRLSTDRLFFNPGKTSSILEEAKPSRKDKEKDNVLQFKESCFSMMEMESTDPFADFKNSIQEMVEADVSLKEWKNLQKLLNLYLMVNDNINHGYIIGAFIDLFVNVPSPLSSSLSSINGQKTTLVIKSGSNRCTNKNNNNNKLMISSVSTKSASSFTSSSSSSGTHSSTCSHCLSSCSLEDDEEDDDNHRDDEDHHSP